MKKRLSLVLAVVMVISMLSAVTAFAADEIKESASGFYYVEANGEQVALSVADRDLLIEADGLLFKDLNKNGELDAYEDWRLSAEERADNLIAQFTLEELVGSFTFVGPVLRRGYRLAKYA